MSTKNPEDMNDAELEAAQSEADRANGQSSEDTTTSTTEEGTTSSTGEGEDTTTAATSTSTAQASTAADAGTTGTAGTTSEAQTSAVADGAPGRPAGVASKDGQRILPYSALQAERRTARRAEARAAVVERENERLKKEVEDLRAGRSPDSGELTEEEVQRMEADFPAEGKKLRAIFERHQEQQKREAEASAKEPDDVADDPIQEAIDQVPLLVEWQHDEEHADKWKRAVAIDNVLKESRKWQGKPAVDRFQQVARMVAEEFDIEVPDEGTQQQTSSTQSPAKQTAVQDVTAGAKRQPPSTLSDLKSGSVPDHGQVHFEKLAPATMLNRFLDMDPAEIDRHLEKLG